MPDRDDDERRDRSQRAVAAGLGAAAGAVMAGPAGAIAGAVLGPMLEPLVRGAWSEISESARRRQEDVLASAIHAGIPVDEMEERIDASERTKLITGLALSAASRTAWEDKVCTLGRSLASGLLADDDTKIDTEQMIIAAIADIEGPQLAMLEVLVAHRPARYMGESPIVALRLPEDSRSRLGDGSWDVASREWSSRQIAFARPNLAPLAPSLLGTLQRHGLIVQNDKTGEALKKYASKYEEALGRQYRQEGRGGAFRPTSVPRVSNPERLAPEPTWSPTELGEDGFLRFRDAGTGMDGGWNAGPTDHQAQL